MKGLLLVLALVLVSGCVSVRSLPGETLINAGSPALKRDVLRVLKVSEKTLAPDCPSRIVDTKIIEPPRNLTENGHGLVSGKWVERWTLNHCGTNVSYRMEFNAQGTNGTDIRIQWENPNRTNSAGGRE